MNKIKAFLPKVRTLFLILKKGQWRPIPTSSCHLCYWNMTRKTLLKPYFRGLWKNENNKRHVFYEKLRFIVPSEFLVSHGLKNDETLTLTLKKDEKSFLMVYNSRVFLIFQDGLWRWFSVNSCLFRENHCKFLSKRVFQASPRGIFRTLSNI